MTVDYYIDATDLAGNAATHGNAATPHFISVGGVFESGAILIVLCVFVCVGLIADRRHRLQ
ncbi:MAG: hypothetical protein QW620_00945 [Thermoplasmata archaeon]